MGEIRRGASDTNRKPIEISIRTESGKIMPVAAILREGDSLKIFPQTPLLLGVGNGQRLFIEDMLQRVIDTTCTPSAPTQTPIAPRSSTQTAKRRDRERLQPRQERKPQEKKEEQPKIKPVWASDKPVPRGFWSVRKNRSSALEWLEKTTKKQPNDIPNSDFKDNYLGGLLVMMQQHRKKELNVWRNSKPERARVSLLDRIPIEKRIEGLNNALENKKTPKQFRPNLERQLKELKDRQRAERA